MDRSRTFGQLLKEHRKALDLTQEALASLAGCSLSSIRKIESGVLRPSRQVADLLAQHLQIPPDERVDFVRLARAVAVRHQAASHSPHTLGAIPIPLTDLVGREREIMEARGMLDAARLVTLTGPPGTGKTRLAIHVAGEVSAAFRDGVCFVALAPVSDPALVLPSIAAALGVQEAPGVLLQDTLAAFLRNRSLLLLLDNFEQVIAAAPRVSQLLAAALGLKVLVTSREELRLRGERIFGVPPLALPGHDPSIPFTELGSVESVALFLQRAQDSDAGFTLTGENAPQIAAICRRLEGLPLALELAAAWIPLLTPQGLLEMLESRLPMLSRGARDLPPHQQTLRDAIARSYDLLTAVEQSLFRSLAVFAGGSTVEAAEAVWTNEGRRLEAEGRAPAVLGGLGSLRSKSLLRVERAGDTMRFVMLEMIREYASEQLVESGEDREARRAHAFYYLGLAEEMERHANGPEGSEQLARIEREYANARAALQWLLQEGDVAHAARLAAALGIFWRYHGHWTEGMGWLEAILLRSDDAPAELRPRLLRHAGVLSTFQGEYIRADDYFDKAITLARQLEAWVSLAETLESRAMLAVLRDEYSYAEVYLQECLALYRELGDEHGVAMALNGLGHHAYAVGDNHKAEEMLTDALSLFEALGDTWGTFRTRQNLGQVVLKLGDYSRTRALNIENLRRNTWLNNRSGIASTIGQLAMLSLAEGDYDEAQKLAGESYETLTSLGANTQAAIMLLVVGMAAAFKEDYEQAEAICAESLMMLRPQGAPYDIAGNLIVLAATAVAHGQPERAARLLGATEAMVRAMGADIWPSSERLMACAGKAVCAQLSDHTFKAAQAEGASMSIQAACDYALEAHQAHAR